MKNLILLAVLCLLTTGLLAEAPIKAAAEKSSIEPSLATSSSPQQLILGHWTLKTIDGMTEIEGQALEGYINFDSEGNFKSVMLGDPGNGQYKVLDNQAQLELQMVEDGTTSIIRIEKLSPTELMIAADGSTILMVK
jgi:hypothetical protein